MMVARGSQESTLHCMDPSKGTVQLDSYVKHGSCSPNPLRTTLHICEPIVNQPVHPQEWPNQLQSDSPQ